MGAGYWLNPDTGRCVRVATTHDKWVRDQSNAESIGLSRSAYAKIMRQPATAVDEIRLVALDHGLIRIREHPRYVSVQFAVRSHRVTATLNAVLMALKELKIHPDATLVIDNLFLNDSVRIGLRELEEKVTTGVPLLREQSDFVPDVPMDHPMLDEMRRQAGITEYDLGDYPFRLLSAAAAATRSSAR